MLDVLTGLLGASGSGSVREMITQSPDRKPWVAPRLTRIVPDATMVRRILDANGIREVPPALAHLIVPTAADSER